MKFVLSCSNNQINLFVMPNELRKNTWVTYTLKDLVKKPEDNM